MADDGFTPQVEWILRHCTGRNQTMLFSATLDGDVGHLIRHYLNDPVEVAIDAATDTVGTMHHLFLAVHHMDKDKVIGAIGQGIPKIARVLPDQAHRATGSPRNLDDLGVERRGDPRRPAAEGPRAGAAAVRRGQARRARRHRRRGPWHRHRRHRRGHPLRAGRRTSRTTSTARGRTARAGRDGWAVTLVEYNQHTQMRILQRGCGCRPTPPIEVFSQQPEPAGPPAVRGRRHHLTMVGYRRCVRRSVFVPVILIAAACSGSDAAPSPSPSSSDTRRRSRLRPLSDGAPASAPSPGARATVSRPARHWPRRGRHDRRCGSDRRSRRSTVDSTPTRRSSRSGASPRARVCVRS